MVDLNFSGLLANCSDTGRTRFTPITMYAVVTYANMRGVNPIIGTATNIFSHRKMGIHIIWLHFNISKLFKKVTSSFDRPEITLYNLRRSCASMLINKGWDVKKPQYWLGHTDTQIHSFIAFSTTRKETDF